MEIFPADESNFIIQVAMKTAQKYNKAVHPAIVKVHSEIPLARGLGSSAAAIVAGIELADLLGDLNLSKQEKFEMAAVMEGHPDNAGASLLGGLVIGCQTDESVDAVVFMMSTLILLRWCLMKSYLRKNQEVFCQMKSLLSRL